MESVDYKLEIVAYLLKQRRLSYTHKPLNEGDYISWQRQKLINLFNDLTEIITTTVVLPISSRGGAIVIASEKVQVVETDDSHSTTGNK